MKLLALAVIGLLLPIASVESAPPAPLLPRASVAFDTDGNRIFDDLDIALAGALPEAPLDVIVVFTGAAFDAGLRDLQRAIGPLDLRREFSSVPGVALSLIPAQIRTVAALETVRQVELDVKGEPQLDTSTRYVGAQSVWADLGLTGDLDGDPSTFTKDDVTIAVIDTGINPDHADFAGKIIGWFDAIESAPTPREMPDHHGHGTHVASIAAGRGLADPAHKGVAPGASLVVLRAGEPKSDAIACVEWVIAHRVEYGIDIVTMSLGYGPGGDGTDSLSLAYDRAFEEGLVTVVSAGNSGPRQGTLKVPADARHVLTVGNVADPGENGWRLEPTSSRGPTVDGRLKPDLVAPGVAISAADWENPNGYKVIGGTSMAAPHVAGVAALVLSANPSLTNAQVREILVGTAHDRGFPGLDDDYGAGVVDAYAAVARALRLNETTPVKQPRTLTFTGNFDRPDAYFVEVAGNEHAIALTAITAAPLGSDWNFTVEIARVNATGPSTHVAWWSGSAGFRQWSYWIRNPDPGTYAIVIHAVRPGAYVLDVSADLLEDPPWYEGSGSALIVPP